MALTLCSNCRLPVNAAAHTCPNCTAPMKRAQPAPSRGMPVAAALALVAAAALLTRRIAA